MLSLLAADQAMLRSELSKRLVEKKISGNSTGQEVLFRGHSVKPAIPCFLRKTRTPFAFEFLALSKSRLMEIATRHYKCIKYQHFY